LRSKKLQFFSWLERFTGSSNWKIKITLLSIVLSLFFAFPSYQTYRAGKFDDKWDAVTTQISAPFQQRDYSAQSHFSKLAFRLTVPVIANVLHLQRLGCFVIDYLFFILMFYLLLLLSFQITQDRIAATLITFGFAFMFVGNVLVSDVRALFDCAAFALMLLVMVNRNFFLIILFALLAFFTDERALITSSLIALWFMVRDSKEQLTLKFNSSFIALVCSWIFYFILRYLLGFYFGLKTESGWTMDFAKQLDCLFFGLWTGLEGFWIPVVVALILLCLKRNFILLSGIIASMLVVLAVAFAVIDITRSIAYIFPVIFISLHIIQKTESLHFVRNIALLTFIVCLFPTYYTDGGGTLWFFYPLPMRIIGIFAH
jgi:hypothetical protein